MESPADYRKIERAAQRLNGNSTRSRRLVLKQATPPSLSHWYLHNSHPGTPVRVAEQWGQNDGRKELVSESVFIVLPFLLRSDWGKFLANERHLRNCVETNELVSVVCGLLHYGDSTRRAKANSTEASSAG